MYEIRLSRGVEGDLAGIPVHYRAMLLDEIERQLSHTPDVETRNRKMLVNLIPPFEAVPPIWELRVGAYRVFYDVDEKGRKVLVRAIRRKPPHLTTEEIL